VVVNVRLVDPVGNLAGAIQELGVSRRADFLDGMSNTLMVGESAGRPTSWRTGGHNPDPNASVYSGPWASPLSMINLRGATWDGGRRDGPCAINCTNNLETYSFHPGGANVLFADGSVRFLKQSIDIRIMARLITRAGGEVVSEGDY